MKSLKNMDIHLATMKCCHSIWPHRTKGKLDPINVQAACYRAKMLTSTYMLQTITCKFDNEITSPTCQLCNTEDESMTHFLCNCPDFKKVRKYAFRYLYNQLTASDIPVPRTDSEKVILVLNGHISNQNINRACSNVCYKLHIKRHELLKEKGLFKASKKKKIPKKFDPKNACISCTKEVKDDHRGIQCDLCELWQHIKCEKIMDGWRYNRIKKGTEALTWLCMPCKTKMIELVRQRIGI